MLHSGRTLVLAAGAVLLSGVATPSAFAGPLVRNCSPLGWLADDVRWSRDVNPHNHIDDLIDASSDPTFDVLVNYKRCVEPEDMAALAALGPSVTVQQRWDFISSVSLGGLTKADIARLVHRPEVAFVEMQVPFYPDLDVSVPNIKVAAGFYSFDTLEDLDPSLDGAGTTIAVVDSGVDNGHHAFATTQLVGTYNVFNHLLESDPVDNLGHGTHVASIALGQVTANHGRGVAPAARLVDLKVFNHAGEPATTDQMKDGLGVLYKHRIEWGVDVVNLSLSNDKPSDGQDALSMLVNLGDWLGMVMVVSAGKLGPANGYIPAPAAADDAITVAASDDLNTQTRDDDGMLITSSRGPRADDGDADCLDELKPDVAAPGTNIVAAAFDTPDGAISKNGTSMAAPHVAGLAALIIQARPGITPEAVKQVLIATAEQKGPLSTTCDQTDQIWNREWGFGLVNGFQAIYAVEGTDLTFPHDPPTPIWTSQDIITLPDPPKKNVNTHVTVMVTNLGPNDASRVDIRLAAGKFSPNPVYQNVAGKVGDIPAYTTVPVTFAWQPPTPVLGL